MSEVMNKAAIPAVPDFDLKSPLRSYLPAEVSAEEIAAAVEKAVTETGALTPKDMGKVMKAVMAHLAFGPVDGKKVSEAVRRRLGG